MVKLLLRLLASTTEDIAAKAVPGRPAAAMAPEASGTSCTGGGQCLPCGKGRQNLAHETQPALDASPSPAKALGEHRVS